MRRFQRVIRELLKRLSRGCAMLKMPPKKRSEDGLVEIKINQLKS